MPNVAYYASFPLEIAEIPAMQSRWVRYPEAGLPRQASFGLIEL
jgi:hypothetical protein